MTNNQRPTTIDRAIFTLDLGLLYAQVDQLKQQRSPFSPSIVWQSIEDEQASTLIGGSGDPDRPVIAGTILDTEATQKIKIRLKSYDH